MRFRSCFMMVASLFLSSQAFSYQINWHTLDQFIGKRSLEQIEADLKILLDQAVPEVKTQFDGFFVINRVDRTITVQSGPGKAEYTFPIMDQFTEVEENARRPLAGYTIAIDGNNLIIHNQVYYPRAQAISGLLAEKLRTEGATVHVTQARSGMVDGAQYASIVDEVYNKGVVGNEVSLPDIALAIRFKSGGLQQPDNTFVSFCPGCFMKGELNAERFRYRIMHALVSGKVESSARLAAHIAAKVEGMNCGMDLLRNERTFEDPKTHALPTCGIPVATIPNTCDQLGLQGYASGDGVACVPGVLGRNLFFNSVPALANVWINPGDGFLEQSDEAIAEAYFQGVKNYVLE